MNRRSVTIKGQKVTFSQKAGQFYRNGRPVTSQYQVRLAKGILAGKTVGEARGHPFGKYEGKRLTSQDIEDQEEFQLGEWAERPLNNNRGKEKATYYIKVSVTSDSVQKVGSPTGENAACQPMTMQLRNPDQNAQTGFTFSQVAKNFEKYALFTVKSYGLTLCTGDLRTDLIAIWRHSRK